MHLSHSVPLLRGFLQVGKECRYDQSNDQKGKGYTAAHAFAKAAASNEGECSEHSQADRKYPYRADGHKPQVRSLGKVGSMKVNRVHDELLSKNGNIPTLIMGVMATEVNKIL